VARWAIAGRVASTTISSLTWLFEVEHARHANAAVNATRRNTFKFDLRRVELRISAAHHDVHRAFNGKRWVVRRSAEFATSAEL
jgi:hypothetical protein